VLTTTQVAAFTTTQIPVIETADLAALGTARIAALTTAQVQALTTTQVAAFTTSQFAGFETADLAVLSSTQVKAFGTSDITQFTETQLKALHIDLVQIYTTEQLTTIFVATKASLAQFKAAAETPLILDLDGGGVRTLNVSPGVLFDIDGDGSVDRTGWVAAGEGLLVRDLSGDGIVNDGSELFGSATRLPNGSLAKDGFQALSALDANADRKIDASDPASAELRVWVDSNSDAITDPGELKTLAEAGVRSISLDAQPSTQVDQGNLIGLISSYETTDGETRDIVDVWFRVSPSEQLDKQASVLGGALKAFQQGDGSGSAGTGGAGGAEGGTDGGADSPQTSLAPLQPAELGRALREFDLHRSARAEPTFDEKALGGGRQGNERERRVEPTLGQPLGPGGGVLGGGGGAGDD
jgi:hypothetical protein